MLFNPLPFKNYLKEVDIVLNSEPLLIYSQGSIDLQNPEGFFDQLLDAGIYKNALNSSLTCIDSGLSKVDSECYMQSVSLKNIKLHSKTAKTDYQELQQFEFETALMATLSAKEAVFGKLNSPYGKYLSNAKAERLVKAMLQQLNLLSEHWSFYWYNPAQFDLKSSPENFYFWRLMGDCCLVFHDHQQHYFTLFTTGTD